jgi:hypothetical protein
MSSVLDTIRRVFGRERGNRPDPGNSREAALPTPAGAAETAMPPAVGEPALAMPGEEAELPIQPVAPPSMTAPPAWTESPVEASLVRESTGESTEVEQVAEPTSPPSDVAAEPLGQGRVQDLPTPGGLVEETVQPSVVEEPLAAAVIEETVQASVVEGSVAELEGQEQAVEAEPLAPSPSPEPLESAPAVLPTRPEDSPEQQTAVESPAQGEPQ